MLLGTCVYIVIFTLLLSPSRAEVKCFTSPIDIGCFDIRTDNFGLWLLFITRTSFDPKEWNMMFTISYGGPVEEERIYTGTNPVNRTAIVNYDPPLSQFNQEVSFIFQADGLTMKFQRF
ncbi:hypothetical protein QR680_011487 [Steinernema hermaphroditum]|uniref:DOMON domain-containing protein n=1 Tax=Steinernema hermaphroditum TaxID=289476 RepID=A0AA39LZ22_9BILA|nr:hypothetical protein QR680_011487 [Steinernema hermaphroditum]